MKEELSLLPQTREQTALKEETARVRIDLPAPVTTNQRSELVSAKVMDRLSGFGIDVSRPDEIIRALTRGENGNPQVPDEVKDEIIRGLIQDNTEAVKLHQSVRQGLLKQLTVEEHVLQALSDKFPDRSAADIYRLGVTVQLNQYTYLPTEPDGVPNFQKWNQNQLMETLNVLRTLGMHSGVVQLFERVESYYKDIGQPSPWNTAAQHLYSYALIRNDRVADAQSVVERLTIDGKTTESMGGAGQLTFGALAEAYTKNARLTETVMTRVEQGDSLTEKERVELSRSIAALPRTDFIDLMEYCEQKGLSSDNPSVAVLAANLRSAVLDYGEEPDVLRIQHMLNEMVTDKEFLEKLHDRSMLRAFKAAEQGYLETGSNYTGLVYLRRAAEREISLMHKVSEGSISQEELPAVEKEIQTLGRLREHLPAMILNSNIAEGAAHPVLVWNRGNLLELNIVRGRPEEVLTRDVEKLILAVDREAQSLKSNPLFLVPGAEGPGWKLGMIMRRIQTTSTILENQLALAENGETRFGSVDELEQKLSRSRLVLEKLDDRVSQYQQTGKVYSDSERREVLARHQSTESTGEALARWTYTLREAVSDALPMEISGNAKGRGGIIETYITNEQDKQKGAEILKSLDISGDLNDRDIDRLQRHIRERFHSHDLQNLTSIGHQENFDLPQELAFLLGGGGTSSLRLGYGCPTSLFSAVELTPGDCRAHAQLFGGCADLSMLKEFRTQHQTGLTALLEDDMEMYADVVGRRIPEMLRREISQTTAEMIVSAKVNGVYDIPHGASTTTATFVARPWTPGESLTDHELKTGYVIVNLSQDNQRIIPAAEARGLTLNAGDNVTVFSKAEEHTFNNEITYGLKPGRSIGGLNGKQYEMMEVDVDTVLDYRSRDAFYTRQFEERDAPLEQQSVYDLGNRKLEIIGWREERGEQVPILDGGPIKVEQADGTISNGRLLMSPRSYSKNPIMYDHYMPVGIQTFGMDSPQGIQGISPVLIRNFYGSWIGQLENLKKELK